MAVAISGSLFLWPSVTVRCGLEVLINRRVVKADVGDTFYRLLEIIDSSLMQRKVLRVIVSKNERFIDPVHEVPIDAPVILCEQYGSNICYHLLHVATTPVTEITLNAFAVLMKSSHERVQPKKVTGVYNVYYNNYYIDINRYKIN